MKKKETYCVNHADIAAANTCSLCGKPICFNCTLKVFGHTFCSGQCINKYVLKSLIKSIFRPFTKIPKLSGRGWLELVLVLGLILCLFFIWKLNRDLKSFQSEIIKASAYPVIFDSTKVIPSRISEPTRGGI